MLRRLVVHSRDLQCHPVLRQRSRLWEQQLPVDEGDQDTEGKGESAGNAIYL
jgi:hypothetical protein